MKKNLEKDMENFIDKQIEEDVKNFPSKVLGVTLREIIVNHILLALIPIVIFASIGKFDLFTKVIIILNTIIQFILWFMTSKEIIALSSIENQLIYSIGQRKAINVVKKIMEETEKEVEVENKEAEQVKKD